MSKCETNKEDTNSDNSSWKKEEKGVIMIMITDNISFDYCGFIFLHILINHHSSVIQYVKNLLQKNSVCEKLLWFIIKSGENIKSFNIHTFLL